MSEGKSVAQNVHWDDRTVRVLVPASVAFDLKKMQKVTAEILGRIGCPGCHSGRDIRFIMERDFVVNPVSLEVSGRFAEGM